MFRRSRPAGSGQRVLIIDDDPDIADLVGLLLEKLGIEVHAAFDGAQGLRVVTELKPDLVILDMMIPAMDGWAVLRRIRSLSDALVMMLTALVDEASEALASRLAAAAHITKPFAPRFLITAVQALLAKRVPEN